jgi:hypothetical protein
VSSRLPSPNSKPLSPLRSFPRRFLLTIARSQARLDPLAKAQVPSLSLSSDSVSSHRKIGRSAPCQSDLSPRSISMGRHRGVFELPRLTGGSVIVFVESLGLLPGDQQRCCRLLQWSGHSSSGPSPPPLPALPHPSLPGGKLTRPHF